MQVFTEVQLNRETQEEFETSHPCTETMMLLLPNLSSFGVSARSKFWGVAGSEDFASATLPTIPLIFKAKLKIFVTLPS